MYPFVFTFVQSGMFMVCCKWLFVLNYCIKQVIVNIVYIMNALLFSKACSILYIVTLRASKP